MASGWSPVGAKGAWSWKRLTLAPAPGREAIEHHGLPRPPSGHRLRLAIEGHLGSLETIEGEREVVPGAPVDGVPAAHRVGHAMAHVIGRRRGGSVRPDH